MWLLTLGCGLFGLIIGSFLNVVVWRVPRGDSVVAPPSHCPHCNVQIKPYDNIPVVSWLVLRGRCRSCSAGISVRYPLVELGTGVLFTVMAHRVGAEAVLPAYLYLTAVCVALALIDVDVKRLPDALTLPSYPILAALLGVAAVADDAGSAWVRAMAGGAAMFAVYFLLLLAYPAGMGFGDVKLAGVLGMGVAWLGWDVWAVGLLLGFFAGGLFGVVLMAAGRAGRKTALPFGPFMIGGALVAVVAGQAIADVWLGS